MTHRPLIIGGGISGLSAAYYLNKAGIRPKLIEKAGRTGGVIQTTVQQGCVLEAGPDGFMAAKPWAMDLIREVGLADEIIGSNDHSRITYIIKHGKLVPLPDGLMMMVPTKIMPLVATRLFSWPAKIRMGLDLFRKAKGPQPDRSVYDFLMDHYGRECIDYLAEPLLAGVYGGDPKQMSVNSVLGRFAEIEAKHGSLTRGVLAAPKPPKTSGPQSFLWTLKSGLSQLVEKLTPSADVVRGSVETVERNGNGFRVRLGGDWLESEQLVVATSAFDGAPLLRTVSVELSDLLASIPYTSSITLALGYRKDGFDHPLNGHGFLVPKRERKYLMGCTWVGNKFNFRVPDDMVVLRCFIGGNGFSLTDDRLVEAARNELRTLMGIQAVPVFQTIARWPNAMAQYTVGHQQRMDRLQAVLQNVPGLYLAGNAYRGIGIPDCVKTGKEAAERIAVSCSREFRAV
ncbi:MAG TPA: protoporphyrinogen oxidase [Bryobacteraceae bacterium]|nr:protoporphyrinogen oxidase [Bryobacteraceae bacterium]